MKYTEKNPPLKLLLTNSTCYKGTGKMTPCGVLIHDTGAVNPNLKRYIQPTDDDPQREKWLDLLGKNAYNNDYNHAYRKMGVNCWIGKLADGTVTTIQTLPWDYRPWGCGSGKNGSCNNGWLQFEICQSGKTDREYFEAAYKEACEITAFLCQQFGFDPYGTVDFKGMKVPVILCHADSHKLGLGSNHADIYGYFGLFGKNMDTFRADVNALLVEAAATPKEEKTGNASQNSVHSDDNSTEKHIWERLLSFIPNPYAVAGIMGNLRVESRMNPHNLQTTGNTALGMTDDEYTKAVDDGTYTAFTTDRYGYGLAQWTYPSRKEALLRFAKERGTSIGDLGMQLDFLCQEMNGYKAVMDVLRNATSVRESSDIVLTKYEKPADQSEEAKERRSIYGEWFHECFAEKPTFPYLVRITDTHLNIRKGPGTDYASRGYIKPGTYTIVDEEDGFGLLKAYAAGRNGWVMLKYTEKKK